MTRTARLVLCCLRPRHRRGDLIHRLRPRAAEESHAARHPQRLQESAGRRRRYRRAVRRRAHGDSTDHDADAGRGDHGDLGRDGQPQGLLRRRLLAGQRWQLAAAGREVAFEPARAGHPVDCHAATVVGGRHPPERALHGVHDAGAAAHARQRPRRQPPVRRRRFRPERPTTAARTSSSARRARAAPAEPPVRPGAAVAPAAVAAATPAAVAAVARPEARAAHPGSGRHLRSGRLERYGSGRHHGPGRRQRSGRHQRPGRRQRSGRHQRPGRRQRSGRHQRPGRQRQLRNGRLVSDRSGGDHRRRRRRGHRRLSDRGRRHAGSAGAAARDPAAQTIPSAISILMFQAFESQSSISAS